MLKYIDSRKFIPKDTQGSSVKLLNQLRNEFVHFTPRVWALDLVRSPSDGPGLSGCSGFPGLGIT